MKLRRVVLIVAGAAVIAAGAVTFFDGPTKEYRECVALMWDRKHPEAVKQRKREADLRECEDQCLRYGQDCDCRVAEGQPGNCIWLLPPEREPAANPCDHLSLEELRRADAEASRDRP